MQVPRQSRGLPQKLEATIPQAGEAPSAAAPQEFAGTTGTKTRSRWRRHGEASTNHPNVLTELEAGES